MKPSTVQLQARVWPPLLKKFGDTIERACLGRDAYLDHVFAHEARSLKDETPGPNSKKARNYLRNQLKELGPIPVNFSLSPVTAEAVNRTCKELNVIRDCFINRVLFFLLADEHVCEVIIGLPFRADLPEILGDNERDFVYAPLWSGGLHAVSEIVNSDPFWGLRNIIAYYREQRDERASPLHACLILPEMFSKKPPGLLALNCFLPDNFIPGTAAAEASGELLDELMGEPLRLDQLDPKPAGRRRKAK
jgi:hypothetical protein